MQQELLVSGSLFLMFTLLLVSAQDQRGGSAVCISALMLFSLLLVYSDARMPRVQVLMFVETEDYLVLVVMCVQVRAGQGALVIRQCPHTRTCVCLQFLVFPYFLYLVYKFQEPPDKVMRVCEQAR